MLKAPLYALLIAPDAGMRRAVERGEKTITIREGHRDYQTGKPVMLCCHIEPWAVMADITSVRHCLLAEVTAEEYLADGFIYWRDMCVGLKRFYPSLEPTSPVTVIRWANVRGKLVDQPASVKRRKRKA